MSGEYASTQQVFEKSLVEVTSSYLVQYHFYIICCIRAFYLLSAAAILVVRAIPLLRHKLLNYGARDAPATRDRDLHTNNKHPVKPREAFFDNLLNTIASLKVPHDWFVHFYILSSISGLLWAWLHNHNARQNSLPAISSYTLSASTISRMLLMGLQSYRRLYECFAYTKSNKSTMWFGHYVFGMAFYLSTNIAIWIDDYSTKCDAYPVQAEHVFGQNRNGSANLFSLVGCVRNLYVTCSASYLNILAIVAFVLASLLQHRCHAYLASLLKYTLPQKGLFTILVAPHYTMECIIYAAFFVLATSNTSHSGNGSTLNINWTMFCALFCVAVNLGVTADGTKEWMLTKFPDRKDDIQRRWKLIPLLW